MAHELPKLPYAFTALEPHIDAKTMEIHHGKHHAAYVNNLNAALEGSADLQKKSIEELVSDINNVPEKIRTAVRNNGGGHINHTMFWQIMSADGGGEPSGDIAKVIDGLGGFAKFKEDFAKAGVGRFGSGWAWLIIDKAGNPAITSTANQDNPLMEGNKPVMGLDVWEHAYYLNYQNRRPDYIAAWWNTVNWKEISKRYSQYKG